MSNTIKFLAVTVNVAILLGLWLNEGEGITNMAGLILLAGSALINIIAITTNKTKKY